MFFKYGYRICLFNTERFTSIRERFEGCLFATDIRDNFLESVLENYIYGVLNYADFYVLMPGDNADTVVPGSDVDFPQDGPSSGIDISRISASSFNLSNIGSYQVLFQVSVTETGQL